jgi:DoxX-like protein
MSITFVVITGMAAIANLAAAAVDFLRVQWVTDNMTKYGVPHSWLFALGALKAAGGVGLLAGIAVPLLGAAAALGLVLYFVLAVITVVRSRWYSHIPFPAAFLLLAVGALVVRLAEG